MLERAARWLLLGAAVALLALHAAGHPWAPLPELDGAALTPRLGKLSALLQALAALGAIDLAALVIGTPLARRLGGPKDEWLRVAVRIALGLLVLAHAVLLLAALHALVEPALIALVAIPILVATPRLARRLRTLTMPPPRARWLVALAVVPSLLGAFMPIWGWDALTYHLALPERYLHARAIWFTPLSLFCAFPLDVEMLYTLALPLGGPALAKLINLQFGVLALVAVAALARRASPRAVPFALAIVLADPLFQWELGVAYTDLALAFFALVAVEALLAWDLGEPRAAWRTALFAGACVGVRYPGAVVPLALSLVMAGSLPRHGARAVVAAIALVGAGSALLTLPWLVRNAVFTGNPFAPALQAWLGVYFDPLAVAQQLAFTRTVGYGHGVAAALALPWHLFVRSRAGVYSGSFGFAVGPLYLVGALAALAVAAVRRDRAAALGLTLAALLTALWFVSAQEARYLLPALMLLAAVGGAGLAHLAQGRAATALWSALVIAALGYAAWPELADLPPRFAVALGSRDADAIESGSSAGWMGARLRAELHAGDRVLLMLEPRSFYFRGLDYLPFHVLEGSPVMRLVHDARDARDWRCRLEALGVTHLAVNLDNVRRFHPVPMPGYGATEYVADLERLHGLLQQWAEPLFDDAGRGGPAGFIAARLRPVDGCAR